MSENINWILSNFKRYEYNVWRMDNGQNGASVHCPLFTSSRNKGERTVYIPKL